MAKGEFKNLPVSEGMDLADLIDIESNQVISMAIAKGGNVQAMLLGLSKGELISEEEYFGDTMYYVIEGSLSIVVEDNKSILKKNQIFMVKEHRINALEALEDTKLLQMTMINEEG
jgi:mannose-6-phosphate isomerase-like protein (cupin superfamily)